MLRYAVYFTLLTILTTGCGPDRRPNLVIVIIDTLRPDHLGCYGYARDTSPCIDSLASAGIMYTFTHAQSSWTLPSVTSIMTGLNVREHAAGRRGEVVYAMNPGLETIPLVLHREGYRCYGIFNVYLLSEQFGFNRGFDRYACEWLGNGKAGESVDTAIEWLSEHDDTKPFLLTLHLFDPHDPYDPPDPFDRLFAPNGSMGITWWPFLQSGDADDPEGHRQHLIDLYDGEIAWTDAQLARLFSFLRNTGFAENTVIILTADHGEEFLEHGGIGHGKTMFREVVHIPLIISGPGIPEDSVNGSLRAQTDIFPTVMDMAGIDHPDTENAVSLLDDTPSDRAVPSSNVNSGRFPNIASMTGLNAKVIWDSETDQATGFDLISDAYETRPISPDPALLDSVKFYWSTPPVLPGIESDAELVQSALRDLGYI